MKKWTFIEILILVLEILAPVVSIGITIKYPTSQKFTEDIKLAIIGAGIVIPIILVQTSMTNAEKKQDNNQKKLEIFLNDIDEKINHISPIFEQVFLSRNKRIERFAYRRMGEVLKNVQSALNNNKSGYLKPNEYYEELLYLSKLIIQDKELYKKKFSGEIWAMTSFAEDEWIADEGYEKLWSERLRELVDNQIKTRRICIVPYDVDSIISAEKFQKPSEDSNSCFWALIELLKSYYSESGRDKFVEHYYLSPRDNSQLTEIKGFFAIKLTDGTLHILYGESVNDTGSLTAQVLFDQKEIQEVRNLFDTFTKNINKIDKVIPKKSKENGFMEYLSNLNIKFSN